MFRHQGKSRTFKHNLQIATVLSFVAGIVNVTGFLAIKQLTTNVTGHFALLIFDFEDFRFLRGLTYLLYILSFLFGSFASGFMIEKYKKNKRLNVFVLPTLVEVFILVAVTIFYNLTAISYPHVIACSLLFAMGLQNSFVTKISNAVVRTTHLTGLFTDLGIELSQLFFPELHPHNRKTLATIKLRVYIILFFFLGGITAGFLYLGLSFKANTLLLAALILLGSLFYDDFRFQLIMARRKRKQAR
ncbi:MAG TPA: YoaK family protein [Aequorivita sp.]|nr:YoaK family protein [Aequorivita sp.]